MVILRFFSGGRLQKEIKVLYVIYTGRGWHPGMHGLSLAETMSVFMLKIAMQNHCFRLVLSKDVVEQCLKKTSIEVAQLVRTGLKEILSANGSSGRAAEPQEILS